MGSSSCQTKWYSGLASCKTSDQVDRCAMKRAADAVDVLERKQYWFHAEFLFQPRCELRLACLDHNAVLVQTEGVQHQPRRAHIHRRISVVVGLRRKGIGMQFPVPEDLMTPQLLFTDTQWMVHHETLSEREYCSVDVHCGFVRGVDDLDSISVRHQGLQKFDSLSIGDMAHLPDNSFAESHEVGYVKCGSGIVDSPMSSITIRSRGRESLFSFVV